MWRIDNWEIRAATFDFGSSGQNSIQVSQLFSGDTQLINAIELVEWNQDEIQFLICEACGVTHCKSGDWVSLRYANSLILVLPAFESFYNEDDKIDDEYAPPYYIYKNGIPCFDLTAYDLLRSEHTSLPPVDRIRRLSMREALLAFQWEAPTRVFGNQEFEYRNDLIIASSEGDYLDHIKQLETIVETNYRNESPVTLRLTAEEENIISLFVDAHEFIEWKALAYSETGCHLMLNSEYVIALSDDA